MITSYAPVRLVRSSSSFSNRFEYGSSTTSTCVPCAAPHSLAAVFSAVPSTPAFTAMVSDFCEEREHAHSANKAQIRIFRNPLEFTATA